jgi:hypothetical protein
LAFALMPPADSAVFRVLDDLDRQVATQFVRRGLRLARWELSVRRILACRLVAVLLQQFELVPLAGERVGGRTGRDRREAAFGIVHGFFPRDVGAQSIEATADSVRGRMDAARDRRDHVERLRFDAGPADEPAACAGPANEPAACAGPADEPARPDQPSRASGRF